MSSCDFYIDDVHIHVYVSATVKPVCLPNVGVDLSAERQAWITGWGALRSSGEPTKPFLDTYLAFLPVDYLCLPQRSPALQSLKYM